MKRAVLLVLVIGLLTSCATRPLMQTLIRLPTTDEVKVTIRKDLIFEYQSKNSEYISELASVLIPIFQKNPDPKVFIQVAFNTDSVQSIFAKRLRVYYQGMTEEQSWTVFSRALDEHYFPTLAEMSDSELENFAKLFISILEKI